MNSAVVAGYESPDTFEVRTGPCPECFLCGAPGAPLYSGLTDRSFGAPGAWSSKRCANPKCGLIWLDPMPLAEDLHTTYKNYFTHEDQRRFRHRLGLYRRAVQTARAAYLATRFDHGAGGRGVLGSLLALPIFLSPLHRAQMDSPLRYLAGKTGHVLDVGCGSGEMLEVARSAGWLATGVDFDPQAVAGARRKGLSAYAGELADLRFPQAHFDLITLSHVIEHVPDPIALMRECRRLLRAHGLLVLWTPNADSWGHRTFQSNWRGLEPPRHLYIFNPDSLGELLSRAGFSAAKISSGIRITPFVFIASRLLRRGVSDRQLARGISPSQRLYGHAAALAARAMLLWNPLAGDELVAEMRR